MKYSAPVLAALATVGTAQTATLKTVDYFGNTLASSTADFTPGEWFNINIDLSVAEWSLKELQFQAGSYGVTDCEFWMPSQTKKGSKWVEVGHFHDMCQWPNISDAGMMYLNVENIPQLRNPSSLTLKCMATDVTFSKNKKNLSCSTGAELTAQNNQLANPTEVFWFTPIYENSQTMKMETIGIYTFNLLDIFFRGINPALDLFFVGGNAAIYEKSAKDLLMANGVLPDNAWTQNHKAGHAVTEEQIAMMAKGVISYGEYTYGAETLFAAWPLYEAFNDGGIEGLSDAIFTEFDIQNSKFVKLVTGEYSMLDEFWTSLAWYYYMSLLANEVTAVVMMAEYRPSDIAMWWPRLARAAYLFTLSFFDETP